ncbi:MAG: metallophosphatase [Bacteroidales bacterium]|nr:metallophosphatase [Bacteroidales bacterium]
MNKIKILIFLFLLPIWGFAQEATLTILHTNDTHSQIVPYKKNETTFLGGVMRRAVLFEETKKHTTNTLIVDAGDFFQGSAYFNYYKGKVEIEAMNLLGYEVVTLGNHEFDNGTEALAKRLSKAKFTVVCANYEFKNKKLQKLVKPYTILYKNNLKIGIFGLTTPLKGLVLNEILSEVTYLDAFTAAKETVKLLKDKHCDLIICLSHLGFDLNHDGVQTNICDTELARTVPEIDFIIGGHTHTYLAEPKVINGVTIVQTGSRGENIGKIEIYKQR